ncbi:hypothetical protein WJX74_000237 [Apatococcus lobatus]|uniref:Uncharacterized protein n=1 Tax=Apatococcus lobatus TaxID=904363 RepID=A0AAW1RM36_9CHLO
MGAAASSCSIGEDLLQAICSGEEEARIRKVVTQTPRLAAWSSKISGRTLFHAAAVSGRRDILALLHDTLLRHVAGKNRQKAFQATNAVLNTQNFRGETALLLACKKGHADCVKLLVDLAASPFVTDSDNRTCLHHAATYGWTPCIKVLADMRVQTSAGPIYLPACSAPLSDGQLRFVDTQSVSGFTALHMAAAHGHYSAVKALISAKATLTMRCQGTLHIEALASTMWPHGTTPLHMAASRGNLPMSRLMLQSDLVAAMSHESQRDLRALTDANSKAPVDVARGMGADASLIQLLDPTVPLEVVLTRLIAASAPSMAAIAAAAKRKQLRKKLRKMHHDSHHKKHSCKRDKVLAAGSASAAAEPSSKKQEAGGTSEDAVEETSSQDEGHDAADTEAPTAATPATASAGPSGAQVTLRCSREARAAAGEPRAAAGAQENLIRSSRVARRPKLSRSSKSSGLRLARRSGAIADEDSDELCKICYDRNVEFHVAGCEHPVCYKCAKLICRRGARDNPLCPFCRQGIEGFTRCQVPANRHPAKSGESSTPGQHIQPSSSALEWKCGRSLAIICGLQAQPCSRRPQAPDHHRAPSACGARAVTRLGSDQLSYNLLGEQPGEGYEDIEEEQEEAEEEEDDEEETSIEAGGRIDTPGKAFLLGISLLYVGVVLVVPTANVFYQAFRKGFMPFLEQFSDPDLLQAIKMTGLLALTAVPLNTLFGVVAAIQITRNNFWGKSVLISLLDLPFSISPVVAGLMLTLLYGRNGWFAPIIRATNFPIVFAFPGMALATIFVTLPFVARELIPILEAMDLAEEEAARTLGANDWQVFWNVTLPNIRWGLIYGIILTNARAMGEFGAVSVISGNIIGKTQTLTLFVESSYKEYNNEAAFSASVLLCVIALISLIIKERIEREFLKNE